MVSSCVKLSKDTFIFPFILISVVLLHVNKPGQKKRTCQCFPHEDKQNSWVSMNSVKWSHTGAAVQFAPLHGWHGGAPQQSARSHGLHRRFWRGWGWRLWDGWLGTPWASVIQPSQPLWVTSSTVVTLSSARSHSCRADSSGCWVFLCVLTVEMMVYLINSAHWLGIDLLEVYFIHKTQSCCIRLCRFIICFPFVFSHFKKNKSIVG